MAGKLRVTLRKSPISYTAKTRGSVRALGLRRIGQTVEVADTPQTRGMARAIRFLVEVVEIGEPASETAARGTEPAGGRTRARSESTPREEATSR